MNRRELLRTAVGGMIGLSVPGGRLFAAPSDYTGRLLICLQATGGWDVASFCDPKVNQPGEAEITAWSRSADIEMAGNIAYAPYANNAALFGKYYRDILVINGIDAQTNAHSVGVTHNWSGRNSSGYPSLTALFAASKAPDLPMAYVNFGGYAETGRLIRYARLQDVGSLRAILEPNTLEYAPDLRYRQPETLRRIRQAQSQRLARLRNAAGLLPRQQEAMDAYAAARDSSSKLADFAAVIPPEEQLQPETVLGRNMNSRLLQQAQVALLAFGSGVACAADLYLGGFDTHSRHDELHEPLLANLADALDYLWATAEQQGLAERLTVVVASDFSRTPFYNSSNGKDHWPIGSAIVMEKNAVWANRVIGSTDGAQNADRINPLTLTRDDANGTIIYPKHVHKALRNYLGLSGSLGDQLFPFSATEDFRFFEV